MTNLNALFVWFRPSKTAKRLQKFLAKCVLISLKFTSDASNEKKYFVQQGTSVNVNHLVTMSHFWFGLSRAGKKRSTLVKSSETIFLLLSGAWG